MNHAILPHVLTVFAIDSTLVYSYDLRPIYDTDKYYTRTGGVERNEDLANSITRSRVYTM